ncbi:MAG: LysM peptidoglycan-binding domain-containing protein [Patescibacteria group bacterium]
MQRKKFAKNPKPKNGILLGESYTNLILGAIVVIAIGIALVILLRNNKQGQTSSTTTQSSEEKVKEETTSSVYTIKAGDSLWSISENVYKSGYNWIQIAKENNLKNPSLIYAGNKIKLSKIDKTVSVNKKSDGESAIKEKPTANNAITENKYTVKRGDNLWNISVRAYGDGFRYAEIAKANNLVNPRIIHSGNVLTIPRA